MSQPLKKVSVCGVQFLVPTTVGFSAQEVLKYIAEHGYIAPDKEPKEATTPERPKPFLAPHGIDAELCIRRAPNGGYTVYAAGAKYERDETLGAFSSAADMLEALSSGLMAGAA